MWSLPKYMSDIQNRWWAREEKRLYVLVEASLATGEPVAGKAVQHLELYLKTSAVGSGNEWTLARVVDCGAHRMSLLHGRSCASNDHSLREWPG